MKVKLTRDFGFLICILTLLMSCENKETHIYKLESLSVSENRNDELFIGEYFVISSPPSNNGKLIDIIRDFNDSIFVSDLSNQGNISRKQYYYKETGELNKDFKEKDPNVSGYFEKVDIACYHKSLLFTSDWTISGKVVGYYTSYLNGKRNTIHFVYPDKPSALGQIIDDSIK
jgi:hypothetical protein